MHGDVSKSDDVSPAMLSLLVENRIINIKVLYVLEGNYANVVSTAREFGRQSHDGRDVSAQMVHHHENVFRWLLIYYWLILHDDDDDDDNEPRRVHVFLPEIRD